MSIVSGDRNQETKQCGPRVLVLDQQNNYFLAPCNKSYHCLARLTKKSVLLDNQTELQKETCGRDTKLILTQHILCGPCRRFLCLRMGEMILKAAKNLGCFV